MSRGGGVPRPIIVPKAAVVLELIGLALFVIARTTGAGWNIVLLCGIIAVVMTGSVLPAFVLARVEITAHAPPDATVGRPFPIELHVRGHQIKLRVLTGTSDWVRIAAPSTGGIMVTPDRRGVLRTVRIEIVTAAPLGLARWQRRMRVPLPVPVEVAPLREPTACLISIGDVDAAAETTTNATGGNDIARGVREYVDGDPIRSVHWPATARTGIIMIRELEGPRRPQVVIVADLRGPDPEGVACRAAGMADDALRQGARVHLATAEVGGPQVGEVPTAVHVGRRLARAVVGSPAVGPFPAGASIHHLGGGGHR